MLKIEHIGIAVKDLEKSNQLFAKLLGKAHYKIEEVTSENVNTSFFKMGESKIELLEATDAESPIAKFIENSGFSSETIIISEGELNHSKGSTIIDLSRKIPEIVRDGDDPGRVQKFIADCKNKNLL